MQVFLFSPFVVFSEFEFLTCCILRWNLVVDGCIDGYSRLVPYLIVHTDNFAMSAFGDFTEGITNYGIPSHVRTDNGSEFVHVNAFMMFANGENRGSFLAGRSVHNQRIERLWRDVFCKVLQKYYNLFHHMESHKIFDIDNPVQISCLHHTFASHIGKDLSDWRNAHNNHKRHIDNYGMRPLHWILIEI